MTGSIGEGRVGLPLEKLRVGRVDVEEEVFHGGRVE